MVTILYYTIPYYTIPYNTLQGFKPLPTSLTLVDPHTRAPLRQGMQTNPGSTAYLLLKYSNRGSVIFYPFAGTLGEIIPTLRLGYYYTILYYTILYYTILYYTILYYNSTILLYYTRRRVFACELDARVWETGMDVLKAEVKIHLSRGVDLMQTCEDGLQTTDSAVALQSGLVASLQGQELPFSASWLFPEEVTMESQELMFGVKVKDITMRDALLFAPKGTVPEKFEKQWAAFCKEARLVSGGAGTQPLTMRGLFNSYGTVVSGATIAIVPGYGMELYGMVWYGIGMVRYGEGYGLFW